MRFFFCVCSCLCNICTGLGEALNVGLMGTETMLDYYSFR